MSGELGELWGAWVPVSSAIEKEQECHFSSFGQHELVIILGFVDVCEGHSLLCHWTSLLATSSHMTV
jgi:hypothetical protein